MASPDSRTERPLDAVASIKVKIGLLVALSIVAAGAVLQAGSRAGVPGWLTLPVTLVTALAVTQWLARGMTSPLREMTRAAGRMAAGDYSTRVTATSADEVGRLARAPSTAWRQNSTAPTSNGVSSSPLCPTSCERLSRHSEPCSTTSSTAS